MSIPHGTDLAKQRKEHMWAVFCRGKGGRHLIVYGTVRKLKADARSAFGGLEQWERCKDTYFLAPVTVRMGRF